MNVVSADFPKTGNYPSETIEHKMIRWRAEAIRDKESLLPLNRLRLMLGGQVRVRAEQLVPEKVDNPKTSMFIFNCPHCDKLGKDYRHGFPERGRYFICNSCGARIDAHEFIGSILHFISGLAGMARLAWRFRRKPATLT